jgi:hypothetical protein
MKRAGTQLHQLSFATLPLSFAAIVVLSGCYTEKPKADGIVAFPDGPARAQTASGYTLDTPIEQIAADPAGAAVLDKDIPGLRTNSNYPMFKSMTLKTVASLSGGRLDDRTLAQTKADLAALPKQASLNH